MSRPRHELYFEEREKGKTYQEIAKQFGVSYQAVAVALGKHHPGHTRPLTEKQCIYPNLRRWMNENKISQAELIRRMGKMVGGRTSEMVRGWLIGRSYPKKPDIDILLKVTGLTYEELFKEDSHGGEE